MDLIMPYEIIVVINLKLGCAKQLCVQVDALEKLGIDGGNVLLALVDVLTERMRMDQTCHPVMG